MQMGYPGYFLVTADLLNYARSVNLRVGPGRGSAARAASSPTSSASPTSTRSTTS